MALSIKGKGFIVILLWTIFVALIVIKAYWIAYNTRARLYQFKVAYPSYDLSGCEPLDLVLVGLTGLLVGVFLSEAKEVLYGYVFTMLSSYVISVTYILLYEWFVLDLGSMFSAVAYGWEWAVFIAASIAFALMFPWIICVCLAGLAFGALLKTWI